MRVLAVPVQLGGCVSKHRPCLSLPVSLSKHGPSAWRLTRRSICRPCKQLSSETEDVLKKYGVGAAAGELPSRRQDVRKPMAMRRPALAAGMGNGVFSLLVINFGMYAVATLFHLPLLSTLALHHWAPKWWQFVSATFVHADWQHLTGNAFSLLIFGRIGETGLAVSRLINGWYCIMACWVSENGEGFNPDSNKEPFFLTPCLRHHYCSGGGGRGSRSLVDVLAMRDWGLCRFVLFSPTQCGPIVGGFGIRLWVVCSGCVA